MEVMNLNEDNKYFKIKKSDKMYLTGGSGIFKCSVIETRATARD